MFVYEATGEDGNLLDDSLLEYVREFETKMLTSANDAKKPWTDYCLLTYPKGQTSTGGACSLPLACISPWCRV